MQSERSGLENDVVHATAQAHPNPKQLPPQHSWESPPAQVPVVEGVLEVDGASLWYWDTGGEGEVVVFSHPASGSALSWEYQQPILVGAGYRVIAYSRRGHYKSDIDDIDRPWTSTKDLHGLLDHLGVDRFHIVAMAAGANIAPDFAVSYPDRILSMMVGCTIGHTGDPSYSANNKLLYPPEFSKLPVWMKELGGFYRYANPEGTAAWKELSKLAREKRVPNPLDRKLMPDDLASISVPKLLFTGASDLYMPTTRLVAYASYWTNPRFGQRRSRRSAFAKGKARF